MNATVSIICYRQKKIKNDEHPIMIRVAKGGKTKYKSLGISVHPDNWDFQTNRPKLKCPNRERILKTILEKETEYQTLYSLWLCGKFLYPISLLDRQ